ncbi:hypothetical protein PSTG_11612 [Puccinia striiformis f. sp. tritici PST-78]|uniref:Uncharacterized protein n=1 Tax=Puccinia striiformis f. sp. tritici PST-78 TaxID=1165861 RepID=A0A0L0V6W9_9BASI|nr:hypothetical protein PSTG_11612 [Puccinia striiformis f. sp. tritici PST-78]
MAAAYHSNPSTSQIIPILWHQETIINPMTISRSDLSPFLLPVENFDKSVDKCGRYNPLNES